MMRQKGGNKCVNFLVGEPREGGESEIRKMMACKGIVEKGAIFNDDLRTLFSCLLLPLPPSLAAGRKVDHLARLC